MYLFPTTQHNRLNDHQGNQFFRALADARAVEYGRAPRKYGKKAAIVNEIVKTITDRRGGRFLERSGDGSSWVEVSMKKIRNKVSMRLRDALKQMDPGSGSNHPRTPGRSSTGVKTPVPATPPAHEQDRGIPSDASSFTPIFSSETPSSSHRNDRTKPVVTPEYLLNLNPDSHETYVPPVALPNLEITPNHQTRTSRHHVAKLVAPSPVSATFFSESKQQASVSPLRCMIARKINLHQQQVSIGNFKPIAVSNDDYANEINEGDTEWLKPFHPIALPLQRQNSLDLNELDL